MLNKPLLFVKNIDREGPGLLQILCEQNGIPYQIKEGHERMQLGDASRYAGIILLGGPQSANDEDETMRHLVNWTQGVLTQSIPMLGICLGLQVMCKAIGGRVIAASQKEIGFFHQGAEAYTVTRTEASLNDRLMQSLPQQFRVFQLHGEMVETPHGDSNCVLLGKGKPCPAQIFRLSDKAYGFQCHMELTETLLNTWLSEDEDLKKLDRTRLLAEYKEIQSELSENTETIFNNFMALMET